MASTLVARGEGSGVAARVVPLGTDFCGGGALGLGAAGGEDAELGGSGGTAGTTGCGTFGTLGTGGTCVTAAGGVGAVGLRGVGGVGGEGSGGMEGAGGVGVEGAEASETERADAVLSLPLVVTAVVIATFLVLIAGRASVDDAGAERVGDTGMEGSTLEVAGSAAGAEGQVQFHVQLQVQLAGI